MKNSYDCIVVGGGPSGAACARTLVQAGLSTALLERHTMPRHKPCSGALLDRAVDFVKEHFGEPPDHVYSEPRRLTGWAWYFPTANNRLVLLSAGHAISVWRGRFDAWLVETSEAEVHEGWRYVTHEEKDGTIECVVSCGDEARTLTCRYLVGADGARSRVRTALCPTLTDDVPWITAYQIYAEGTCELESEYFHLFLETRKLE